VINILKALATAVFVRILHAVLLSAIAATRVAWFIMAVTRTFNLRRYCHVVRRTTELHWSCSNEPKLEERSNHLPTVSMTQHLSCGVNIAVPSGRDAFCSRQMRTKPIHG